MRQIRFAILAFAALLSATVFVRAQTAQDPQDEEGTRGIFMESRAKSSSSSSSGRTSSGSTGRTSNTGRRTTTGAGRRTNSGKSATTANNSGSKNSTTKNTNNESNDADPNEPIGLGYTLYMRASNGDALRVDPEREFTNGDRVRVALESNVSGYLYIFDKTNDGTPEMIYPDARLDDGDNRIEAHVPYEIPSNKNVKESYRWFTFTGAPGVEKLYIVVTRQPLKGVPTGAELVKLAQGQQGYTWKATPAAWDSIQSAATAPVKVSVKKDDVGKADAPKATDAGNGGTTTRELKLTDDDPEPTVVRMSASSTTNVLVTTIDLVHKNKS